MSIYTEIILDHYKNPRNYGKIKNPNAIYSDSNPLCGDFITIYIEFKNNKINDISFEGNGCAISKASASMLTEKLKGQSIQKIKKMTKEDIIRDLGIDLGPVRIKCALLPYKAVKLATYKYLGENSEEKI